MTSWPRGSNISAVRIQSKRARKSRRLSLMVEPGGDGAPPARSRTGLPQVWPSTQKKVCLKPVRPRSAALVLALISANGTPASLLRLLPHQSAQGADQFGELRVADRVGQGQRALPARGRDRDCVGVPVGAALLRRGLLPLEELRPL